MSLRAASYPEVVNLTETGLLVWSIHHAGGTGGPYFAETYQAETLLANSLRKLIYTPVDLESGLISRHSLGRNIWCDLRPRKLRCHYSWPGRLVPILEERKQDTYDRASHRLPDLYLCYL